MSKVKEASKYWENENNCAQAVACGLLEHFKINNCIDIIHSSMIGFGGGMGERSICGAVTGGLAALGILLVENKIEGEQRAEIFKRYKETFLSEIGTLRCREIIADFILPDGSVDKDKPERRMRCTEAVEIAATIVKEEIDRL